MSEKKKIVVHYHIYKAAGSTIIDGLKHQFGGDNVMEVDKHPEYANVKAYNIAFFEELAETHRSNIRGFPPFFMPGASGGGPGAFSECHVHRHGRRRFRCDVGSRRPRPS